MLRSSSHMNKFQPGTDRLKLWVLYSAEDDDRLALASSAGFALLTENEEACRRIIDEMKSWPEVLKDICMHENIEVQRRGMMAIANMVESCEKVASEIVAVGQFPSLIIVSTPSDDIQVFRLFWSWAGILSYLVKPV